MSGSQSEDKFDLLEKQVSGLKDSLHNIEEKVAILHLLVNAEQQQIRAANNERFSTLLDKLTTDITMLQSQFHHLDVEVTDLQSESDLSYQHARAHEIVLQQLIDASPAHQHIDLGFEIENYHPERNHHNYNHLNQGDASEDAQVHGSDPQ